jgi:hypothetical protein
MRRIERMLEQLQQQLKRELILGVRHVESLTAQSEKMNREHELDRELGDSCPSIRPIRLIRLNPPFLMPGPRLPTPFF